MPGAHPEHHRVKARYRYLSEQLARRINKQTSSVQHPTSNHGLRLNHCRNGMPGMPVLVSALDVRRFPLKQAAVLSCFVRIGGSFLPSTTALLIVPSAISSRLGTSYMVSSMLRSSIERN